MPSEKENKKKPLAQAVHGNPDPQRGSEDLHLSRFTIGPMGYSGLKSVSGWIFEESKRELRWPAAGSTYRKMAYDSSVKSALNIFNILIGKVPWNVGYRKGAKKETIEAAEFLTFCMGNMDNQYLWSDFITEVLSYLQYGFHVSEKVYTKVKTGRWQGKYKWKKLATRSQDTLYEWVMDERNSELLGVKQNPSIIGLNAPEGEVMIPRNKFLHFKYGGNRDNPEGESPLKGCYTSWKYKTLVEDYEATGVAKDMGGIVEVGIHVDYLAKAEANPSGPEAKVVERMRADAANLHAGEQAYVMKPIAYDDRGNPLFTFGLKGIDGGGKQYNTDDIIRRKQNEILTVFVADVLKLGQDGKGSFALSDSKNNQLTLAVQYHLDLIKNVLNNDLIPQTLALNGWNFAPEDMPFFEYGDIDDRDLDVLSKFIQRVTAVGAISTDKTLDEALRKVADLPAPDYDKPMPANEANQSRAGDGMKSGMGNGTSNKPAKKDNSAGNNENSVKVLEKQDNGLVLIEMNGRRFRIPEDDVPDFLGEEDA